MTAYTDAREERLLFQLNKSSHSVYYVLGSFTYISLLSSGKSRDLKGRALAASSHLPHFLNLVGFVVFIYKYSPHLITHTHISCASKHQSQYFLIGADFHKKLILTDSIHHLTVVTKDTKQPKSLGLFVNQKILTESCEELLLSK